MSFPERIVGGQYHKFSGPCGWSPNISGNESAVSTHAALEIDKMVVVANATDMLLNLLAVLSETLVPSTGRFEGLLSLLEAYGGFWGRPAARFWAHYPRFAACFAAVRAAL